MESGDNKEYFTVKSWNAVASWTHKNQSETCAIDHKGLNELCMSCVVK